jgi:uncharacterized protein (TIGR03000 family)
MKAFWKVGLLALALVAALAVDTQACHRRSYCQPSCWNTCWYPCWEPCWCPCWPPDTSPFPLPPHPLPKPSDKKIDVNLVNRSDCEAFAYVYIWNPHSGAYTLYEKAWVNPQGPAGAPLKLKNTYYAGDSLLIETWTRWGPWDCWHCRCCCLVTVRPTATYFDVIHCRHWYTYGTEQADAGGEARLIVSLPADARLTVDGAATTSTSALRTFVTPPLAAGKDYTYELRAEFVSDGRPQVVTRTVHVRAGEETRVDLLAAPVATAPAAPPGAPTVTTAVE